MVVLFKENFTEKCKLEWDLNLDRWIRSRARWPLQGPIVFLLLSEYKDKVAENGPILRKQAKCKPVEL